MRIARKVVGIIVAVACFGVALYALFRLIQGGSCASGGNYVSARQCPPGTGWYAVELPFGIIGGLFFLGVAFIEFGGPKPVAPASRFEPNLAAQMFTAGGERPAAWPAHLPWPPGGIDWQQATVVRTPGDDQDPLARLERLRALRDADALTAAEYDAAKAKILSQM